jgi:hypothetical protein
MWVIKWALRKRENGKRERHVNWEFGKRLYEREK